MSWLYDFKVDGTSGLFRGKAAGRMEGPLNTRVLLPGHLQLSRQVRLPIGVDVHVSVEAGSNPRPRGCPGGQSWCGTKGVPSPLMDCADLDSERLQQDQENWCSEASSPRAQNYLSLRILLQCKGWGMSHEVWKIRDPRFLNSLGPVGSETGVSWLKKRNNYGISLSINVFLYHQAKEFWKQRGTIDWCLN